MVTIIYRDTIPPECAPYTAQQAAFLKKAGHHVDIFCFRGQKNPSNYIRAWRELRQQFDLRDYDLLHVQHGQSGILTLFSDLPTVATFHGSDLLGLGSNNFRSRIGSAGLRGASRMVARFADEVIVVANHIAKNLPVRPYHVIPGGVDFDLFRPMSQLEARRTLDLPIDQPLVLFAARTERAVKRYSLAVEAINLLQPEIPARIVVAEDVDHQQMPIYMNACDALILTSSHEGSPTVVKEALACNLPVVTVDVGDVKTYAGSLEGCLICPDDSPITIARELKKVLPGGARSNSREAISAFDERLLTKKLMEVYMSAVYKRKGRHIWSGIRPARLEALSK